MANKRVFSAVSVNGDIPPKHASSGAFRVVHGDKELVEKLGRNDLCPADLDADFKHCCMPGGRYDGALREYYSRE